MAKEKIDQILEKITSLEEGQQKHYDLIQKQGIKLEQVASDVKAVAEGHGVLLNAIEGVKESIRELDGKIEETRDIVKETNRALKEHVQQPAHAGT
ncbi:MAG: hypothetical protein NT099_02785 [Candidatus Saganbacteria bacterium]|nr:hypothetical protein [Candidatus Saganbacteria bacterium]